MENIFGITGELPNTVVSFDGVRQFPCGGSHIFLAVCHATVWMLKTKVSSHNFN